MLNDLGLIFSLSFSIAKYKNICKIFLSLFYKCPIIRVCYKYIYKNTLLITYLNIFSNIVALLDFLYYFCKVKIQSFLIN